MNITEAKAGVRMCVRALSDTNVRNLMEHAANKTPIELANISGSWFTEDGKGG